MKELMDDHGQREWSVKRRLSVNTWLVVISVLGVTLQLALVLGLVATQFPAVYDEEVADLILRGRPNFPHEYDLLIFRFFIVINIMGIPIAWMLFKQRLANPQLTRDLCWFNVGNSAWIMISAFAIYKIVIYQSPMWAVYLLGVSIVAAWLTGIGYLFKPMWCARVSNMFQHVMDRPRGRGMSWIDGLMGLVIGAIIFIKPSVLAVQLLSYGLRLDTHQLWMSMLATWVYFSVVYLFMRITMASLWLSVAGIILALKWHMFHWGVAPLIWLHPPLGILPHGWDIAVFACILLYVWQQRRRYLVAAGIIAGGLVMYHYFHTPAPLHDSPFFTPLRFRAFGAFVMSFIVPLIYMLSLLIEIKKVVDKRIDRFLLWRVAIMVYGLASFFYYLQYPRPNGYFSFSWLLVAVIGFWVERGLALVQSPQRKQFIVFMLLVISAIALLTNQLWMSYVSFK